MPALPEDQLKGRSTNSPTEMHDQLSQLESGRLTLEGLVALRASPQWIAEKVEFVASSSKLHDRDCAERAEHSR